jgi:O-antigen ligase
MTAALLCLCLAFYAWLAFRKPLLALGILVALVPSYLVRFNIFGIPTTMLELLMVVFLIAVFAKHFRSIPVTVKRLKAMNYAIAIFVASGLISIFASPETTKALGLFKAFILEPVLVFYAVNILVLKPRDFELPLKWLFSSASLISLFGIIQYGTGLLLPLRFWGNGEEVRRIVSVFEYPNALALYLAPLFILFLVLRIKQWRIAGNRIMDIGLLIQATALALTFSRGAWLAVGITLIFILLRQFSAKKVTAVLAGLILISVLIGPIRERIASSLSDPSGFARFDLADVAGKKIADSPILGNGLFGFRSTLSEYGFAGEILNYPHNIVLNFWLEMGLLGLLSFGVIIYLSIKRHLADPSVLTYAALAYLSVMLLHGLVDVPYFKNDLAILFWFALSFFWTQK